ncbi:MAG: pentapeptide repeat-containing protein [Gemmataceae bacterium]
MSVSSEIEEVNLAEASLAEANLEAVVLAEASLAEANLVVLALVEKVVLVTVLMDFNR